MVQEGGDAAVDAGVGVATAGEEQFAVGDGWRVRGEGREGVGGGGWFGDPGCCCCCAGCVGGREVEAGWGWVPGAGVGGPG